ncbi:hypothetical protein [Streptomyces nojiriensis]|uniref:hypothetical protein n=1 Tax=Streptomyces nojiriensis TaxID=66374 RepID=UPI002E17B746
MLAEGRRIFDRAGSHEQISDYTVPWWRVNVFVSLLAAHLGDETTTDDGAPREPAPVRHPPGDAPRADVGPLG